MSPSRLRVGILATHPIQYFTPWYRALDALCDLHVFFSHRQSKDEQAAAGFGVPFEWDVPLLSGFQSTFLRNIATRPNVDTFWGCRTPEIGRIIGARTFDAFIVQGWSTASYWEAIRACWRSGTPVLVRGDSHLSTPRSGVRRAVKWPLYRWFIPRFDGYLVVGVAARAYLQHYGADPQRCFSAPHSVDNSFFANLAAEAARDRQAVRTRLGVPAESVTFLWAGKLIDIKRADLFVEAVGRVARQHPQVSGLIVGDGPRRSDIAAAIARDRAPVAMVGFRNQTEMAAAYAASDVLVVPSDRETWGLVVNEAMACGLPAIVSTAVGCAADLILEGETGLQFAARDVGALAEAMRRLAIDAPLRLRMGLGARRHIAAYSSTAAAAGTLEAVAHAAGRTVMTAARPVAAAR